MKFPNTFLYSISWEDAQADKPVLDVKPTDKILSLTGGGDNLFNLILDGAERVDCVDLNPAQFHLMELKINTLRFGDFNRLWELFGEGKTNNFDMYLIRTMYQNISINTFNFWYTNMNYFTKNGLYYRGSMGKVVTLVRVLGLKYVLCNELISKTCIVYKLYTHLIKFMLWLFCTVFCNTGIMWKFFGTPPNQINMIKDETKLSSYVVKSLSEVFDKTDVLNDNHYYYLILNGRFAMHNCPDYLKQENFFFLKQVCGERINNYNTSLIEMMQKNKYDKIILMDHMDWTDETYVASLAEALKKNMEEHGKAIFRSAAIMPWYVAVFEKYGFKVTNVSNVKDSPYIDRVNTYASFWTIEH